jgi:hypothetical protein
MGALGDDDGGNNAGSARVYGYNGSEWVKLGDNILGEAADDISVRLFFVVQQHTFLVLKSNHVKGRAVSLSNDGLSIAIGAPYNDGTASTAGHVRVYTVGMSSCRDTVAVHSHASV